MIDLISLLIARAHQLYHPPAPEPSLSTGSAGAGEAAASSPPGAGVGAGVDLLPVWTECWLPALQSLARACFDSRRSVRTHALSSLQSALLMPQFSTELGVHCTSMFTEVLLIIRQRDARFEFCES